MTIRIPACLLITAVVSLADCRAQCETPPADTGSSGRGSATLVATIYGEPLTLEQVTPPALESQRRELPRREFEDRLREDRGRRTYQAVCRAVLGRYISQEQISISQDEMNAIADSVERRLKAAPANPDDTTFTPEQRKGLMIAWTRASLMDWKVCKSLHHRYGGRVGIGSLGSWIAFDGQTALLRESCRTGDIVFHHPETEEAFWQQTRISNFADAYPEGEQLKRLLETPPYLRD